MEGEMAAKERLKRRDPKRSKPHRAASADAAEGSWADAADTGGNGGTGTRRPTAAIEKVIAEGVGLAYKVAEEQIRAGQRAAEQMRDGSYTSGDWQRDVTTQIDRLISVSRELGVVIMDVLATAFRASATPAAAPKFVLRVRSRRDAEVDYKPLPTPEGFEPVVLPLYALDSRSPPITKVVIEAREGRAVLRVDIPDDQPPGSYAGVVVDAATGVPGGTICVRLS
jgi:hypothetical protein